MTSRGTRRAREAPVLAVGVVSAVALAACGDMPHMRGRGQSGGSAALRAELAGLDVPAEFERGETLFDASCAVCHGEAAGGTDRGPPLVHPYYEPRRHADVAFQLAVQRGVRPHHWSFGPMPPVPGVSRAEVAAIIGYVRWLQREAGVY